MYTPEFKNILTSTLDGLRAEGLYKEERFIASQQYSQVTLKDGRSVINMCANNYLGLANNPEVMEAAKKASQDAKLNAEEAANAVKLAAKGTAERTAELLRLEQLAEELQVRSEEFRARTQKATPHFGKRRMLRAFPKMKHGEHSRSLDSLREQLKRK